MKIFYTRILAVLTFLFVAGTILFPTDFRGVRAASDLVFFLDPEAQAVAPGQEFTLDLKIENPSDTGVKTVGAVVNFDTSVLEVVDADTSSSGTQIQPSGNFPVIADNIVTGNTILMTLGNSSALDNAIIDVASIRFRARSNVSPGTVTTVTIDDGQDDTTIRGDEGGGATELLSEVRSATVVISNLGVSFNPSNGSLNTGDTLTLSMLVDNPTNFDVLTAEIHANYDSAVFQPISTEVDFNTSSFEFSVDKEVSPKIQATVGSPGSSPASGSSLTVGRVVLQVRENAPSGVTSITFDRSETSVFEVDTVTTNMITQYNDAQFTIGSNQTSIGRISIIKSELSTTFDNLIPVAVEDASGNPVPDGTQVRLQITSAALNFSKDYGLAPTSNGIATFTAPGSDFVAGNTYSLFAQEIVSGINDTVDIFIPSVNNNPGNNTGGGSTVKNGGATPDTGPAETLAVSLFVMSVVTALYIDNRKKSKVS